MSKPKWLAVGKHSTNYETRSQLNPSRKQSQNLIKNLQSSDQSNEMSSEKYYTEDGVESQYWKKYKNEDDIKQYSDSDFLQVYNRGSYAKDRQLLKQSSDNVLIGAGYSNSSEEEMMGYNKKSKVKDGKKHRQENMKYERLRQRQQSHLPVYLKKSNRDRVKYGDSNEMSSEQLSSQFQSGNDQSSSVRRQLESEQYPEYRLNTNFYRLNANYMSKQQQGLNMHKYSQKNTDRYQHKCERQQKHSQHFNQVQQQQQSIIIEEEVYQVEDMSRKQVGKNSSRLEELSVHESEGPQQRVPSSAQNSQILQAVSFIENEVHLQSTVKGQISKDQANQNEKQLIPSSVLQDKRHSPLLFGQDKQSKIIDSEQNEQRHSDEVPVNQNALFPTAHCKYKEAEPVLFKNVNSHSINLSLFHNILSLAITPQFSKNIASPSVKAQSLIKRQAQLKESLKLSQIEQILTQKQSKISQIKYQLSIKEVQCQSLKSEKEALQQELFSIQQRLIGVEMEVEERVRRQLRDLEISIQQKLREEITNKQQEQSLIKTNRQKQQREEGLYMSSIATLRQQIQDLTEKCVQYEQYIRQLEKTDRLGENQEVRERVRQCEDMVVEKMGQLKIREESLLQVENELVEQEHRLQQEKQWLSEQAQLLHEKCRLIEARQLELEKAVEEMNLRENDLVQWEQQLVKRDKALSNYNANLNQMSLSEKRQTQLKTELKSSLKMNSPLEQLQERERQLRDKESYLQNKQRQLQITEHQLKHLNAHNQEQQLPTNSSLPLNKSSVSDKDLIVSRILSKYQNNNNNRHNNSNSNHNNSNINQPFKYKIQNKGLNNAECSSERFSQSQVLYQTSLNRQKYEEFELGRMDRDGGNMKGLVTNSYGQQRLKANQYKMTQTNYQRSHQPRPNNNTKQQLIDSSFNDRWRKINMSKKSTIVNFDSSISYNRNHNKTANYSHYQNPTDTTFPITQNHQTNTNNTHSNNYINTFSCTNNKGDDTKEAHPLKSNTNNHHNLFNFKHNSNHNYNIKQSVYTPKTNTQAYIPKYNTQAYMPKSSIQVYIPKSSIAAHTPKSNCSQKLPFNFNSGSYNLNNSSYSSSNFKKPTNSKQCISNRNNISMGSNSKNNLFSKSKISMSGVVNISQKLQRLKQEIKKQVRELQ